MLLTLQLHITIYSGNCYNYYYCNTTKLKKLSLCFVSPCQIKSQHQFHLTTLRVMCVFLQLCRTQTHLDADNQQQSRTVAQPLVYQKLEFDFVIELKLFA